MELPNVENMKNMPKVPNDNYKSKKNKIKVCDASKLKTYKTIFDDKLLETNTEINKEDIIKIFSELLNDETDLENFKNTINCLKEDTFSSIQKRLKGQYKKINRFVTKVVEEEKFFKDSETKIIFEEKKADLEVQTNEKMDKLKLLVNKQKESKGRIQEFYYDKIKNFFEANK
jgi:hypothetical protein